MGFKDVVNALLGISAYENKTVRTSPLDLDSPQVKRMRESMGGQLSQLYTPQTRWYLSDLESARHQAAVGNLQPLARLSKACRQDGILAGLLATRTSGLVRLPKRFKGDSEIKASLEKLDDASARTAFEDMLPSNELALLAADGLMGGVGIAELRPVEGRDFPVLVRLDPEGLVYRWNENRWYYNSVAGQVLVTPGDGQWVLHVPGGRMSPWDHGLVWALGQAWIQKQHAIMHRANFSAKLANPARVATNPQGADDAARSDFLNQVMAWGPNSVFNLPPGWDVKLLESKGEGFKVFQEEIESCNKEIMVAISGSEVLVTGGTGFANAGVHQAIRADLIKETADALAYTINTQCIPQYVWRRWGIEKVQETSATVEWDITPPGDMKAEAEALKAFGEGLASVTVAMSAFGRKPDIGALCARFSMPVADDTDGDGNPDDHGVNDSTVDVDLTELEAMPGEGQSSGGGADTTPTGPAPHAVNAPEKITLAPTDLASIVTVNEARASQGLPPIPDGDMTIVDFRAKHAAAIAKVNDAEDGAEDDDQAAE